MAKDLGLAQEAAQAAGAPAALGAQALAFYLRFLEQGGGDADFSCIIRMIRGEA
jgi:3-hydroxyisobutyrate dehydrogenase